MVYVSRYFIHEMQFVFFTLLAVVAMLRFRPRGAWWWPALACTFGAALFSTRTVGGWVQSRGVYSLTLTEFQFFLLTMGWCVSLMRVRPLGNWNWTFVAAVSLALLFGSKETAPISLVVLPFFRSADVAVVRKTAASKIINIEYSKCGMRVKTAAGFGRNWRLNAFALGATYLFWIVIALFFSSFDRSYFSEGTNNFFAAYDVWQKTGESDFQAKPLLTYLVWMLTIEPTVLLLGFAGIGITLWQRSNRFSVFVALWASGIFAAYSLIPYKTPWLMINFVLPFALMSGVALQHAGAWLSRKSSTRSNARPTQGWKTAIVLAPWLLLSVVQMSYLNFIDYDNDDAVRNRDTSQDPKGHVIQLWKWQVKRGDKTIDLLPGDIKKYPYIYVHTQRGYLDLMRKIDEYAQRSGLGNKMTNRRHFRRILAASLELAQLRRRLLRQNYQPDIGNACSEPHQRRPEVRPKPATTNRSWRSLRACRRISLAPQRHFSRCGSGAIWPEVSLQSPVPSNRRKKLLSKNV